MGVEIMRRRTLSKLSAAAAVVTALLGLAPASRAALLPPGGFLGPAPTGEPNDLGPGSAVVGTTTTPFSSAGFFTGSLTTTVYTDTTNPFGAGKLTFVYQVTNNAGSNNPLTRLSVDSYAGFQTDASYISPGGWAPGSIDRPSAAVVGFNFGVGGPGALPANTTSAQLVVQTDATTFGPAAVQVLGGGQANDIASYAPAVPEPASLGLIAAAGVFALRRRSRD